MAALMIGLYLLLCALLAFAGRRTRVGAAGIFLLALIFTPLAVGLILAILGPPSHNRPSRESSDA